MNKKDEFKPYIPADRVMPELTVTSIIMGVLLAVIFGAANAYLGLRVGMTVSASIPAAVISMGVIRVIMKKDSILESNMVQTIGSAGESLAAGAIFTMPALFLWAEEGLCSMPSLVEITLIALCGGVLGVLFMVPLRNALIVKEHATLLYPEGTACADVLLAGEEGGANASTVFSGMGLAAVFKFIVDGLKVIPADVSAAFKSFKGEIGMEVYPALLGVGYIVGPKIASYMFVGSVFGWLVIIPLICLFGPDTWLYPAEAGTTIAQLYAGGGASAIWSTYVKIHRCRCHRNRRYHLSDQISASDRKNFQRLYEERKRRKKYKYCTYCTGSADAVYPDRNRCHGCYHLGSTGYPGNSAWSSTDRNLRILLCNCIFPYGRYDR